MDRAIIKDSIRHYGADIQTVVAMEECAELIQAISKTIRDPGSRIVLANLTEEMADVLISVAILQEIYDVPDEMLNNWIASKQQRVVERMRKEF